MKNNHFTRNYGVQDYMDYHSGRMSQSAMHELEKAALNDPFLAQALEGYKNQHNIESDIIQLKKRIEKRTKENTNSNKSNHLKLLYSSLSVAASLLIIIVGAYFVLFKNDQEKNNSPVIAQNNPTTINKYLKNNPSETPTTKTDGIQVEKEQQNNTKTTPVLTTVAPTFPNDKISTKIIDIDFDGKKEMVTEPPAVIEDLTIQNSVLSGNSKENEKDAAILAAPITNEKENKQVAVKLTQKKSNADQIVDTKVVASTTMTDLNVTASNNYAIGYNAEPQSGWTNFNQYIEKNKKIILDEQGKLIKGKVILSFIVNKKGRPTKIKVETSLNKKCDEEAIRLIKQGDSWNNVNNKRMSLEINF